MLAIDHIVVTTTDAEQDRLSFTSQYGLQGTGGGNHPDWGTHNELCFFDNRFYIEWLGVSDALTAEKSENPLIRQMLQQQTGNTIQIALRTDNMDDFLEYYEKEGIEYEGPFPGARRRKDGSLLEWRMLFPKHETVPLPFLIEWNGDNFPQDPVYINPLSDTMIEYGTEHSRSESAEVFRNIFRFPKDDSEAFTLTNGQLFVTEQSRIITYLDHIML
ncbi:VOC family protein [Salimicrobium flavidum]|uniref:Glyoxalase-like domain-containing protein n=1 Tax=Salimicrobium flavidum TaxID=570947 RepID=A0A1N7K5W5_9BACI|nr:VOC family protein [Salimicrobium flavidum]SIS57003.1 Glyoxalase-like domain-containing protein [Salimicrobium flavidum]